MEHNYNLYKGERPQLRGEELVETLLAGACIIAIANSGVEWHLLLDTGRKLSECNGREDNTWRYVIFHAEDDGDFYIGSQHNRTSRDMDREFSRRVLEDRSMSLFKTRRVRIATIKPVNGRNYIVVDKDEWQDAYSWLRQTDTTMIKIPFDDDGQLLRTEAIKFTAESVTHEMQNGVLVEVTSWDGDTAFGVILANRAAKRTDGCPV